MDVARLAFLDRHIQDGTIPGAVASYGRTLDPVARGAADSGGAPIRTDAIFRVQSMTKPM
ncbi:hypothetical protein [Microbacterium amylolyticum]|uniref:Serine hydrolase n=1 Tax=Microbacterium amylolyticum TaxID=936337 RepID=A0ABS4ZEZ0_9MICO|nr:hypothetical protein [Microbacterium amylolyticum]MBP2435603.1 hypothetical protein [Microbacterium amylolyticum]